MTTISPDIFAILYVGQNRSHCERLQGLLQLSNDQWKVDSVPSLQQFPLQWEKRNYRCVIIANRIGKKRLYSIVASMNPVPVFVVRRSAGREERSLLSREDGCTVVHRGAGEGYLHILVAALEELIGVSCQVAKSNGQDAAVVTPYRGPSFRESIANNREAAREIQSLAPGATKAPVNHGLLYPVRCVETVHKVLLPRLAQAGCTLRVCYDWPLPTAFRCNALWVSQVLVNLIELSITSVMAKTFEIQVSWSEEAASLRFSIGAARVEGGEGSRNSEVRAGVALNNEDMNERELKLESSQALAARLHGRVCTPGEESEDTPTFLFEVPTGDLGRADWQGASCSSGSTQRDAVKGIEGQLRGRVLIADDAEDSRRIVQYVLRNTGLILTFAINGHEAIERAMHEQFDLILMDIHMPLVNGYDVVATLRRSGIVAPIIALTGSSTQHEIARCLEVGCDGYIPKPFSREGLFHMLQQHLPSEAGVHELPHMIISERISKEPLLAKIILAFIEKLPQRMERISEAFQEVDLLALEEEAHKLAGSSGLMGYPVLSELAFELEQHAKRSELSDCEHILDEIRSVQSKIQNGTSALLDP